MPKYRVIKTDGSRKEHDRFMAWWDSEGRPNPIKIAATSEQPCPNCTMSVPHDAVPFFKADNDLFSALVCEEPENYQDPKH